MLLTGILREQDQPPLARARVAAGVEVGVMEILAARRPAVDLSRGCNRTWKNEAHENCRRDAGENDIRRDVAGGWWGSTREAEITRRKPNLKCDERATPKDTANAARNECQRDSDDAAKPSKECKKRV